MSTDLETPPALTKKGPMRPDMRDESPRAAAERRAAEILGSLSPADEGEDKFRIPLSHIPDGWSYEFKRHTVYNKPDPAYDINLARTGWTPVPLSRHPNEMPPGWAGSTIERDGMILMERPRVVTEQFENIERRKARDQVRAKEAQLGAAPEGQFGRDHAEIRPKLGKSFSPIKVPE